METLAALVLVLAQESPSDANPGAPVLPDGARLLLELADERPDHFGMGIVPLGDADGDGVSDLYVGARAGVSGLVTGLGYGDVFSGLTGKLLHRIEGEPDPDGSWFGCRVRRIEDLDGDGVAEIGIDGERESTSRSYAQVRSGRDGRLLRHWENASIGFDAGDRDGDGRREVVLNGRRGCCLAHVDASEPRLLGPTGPRVTGTTGDWDLDGVGDYLELPADGRGFSAVVRSGRSARILTALWPDGEWGRLKRSSDAVGDTNGDGFVDVLVTCFEDEPQVRRQPAWEARFRLILVSGFDGRVLRDRWEELDGPGDLHAPIGLGDVDGDGCGDVLVAHSLRTSADGSRVRVYSGRDDRTLVEITTRGASLGLTAALVGDLDGDCAPELALGEHEYGSCAGRAWVISLGSAIRKP